MEAMLGLLLMLLGISQGLEMSCDGRKNRVECYGPLEGAALIQLMDDASHTPHFELIKDNVRRLQWVGRLITNLTGSRYAFTSCNGTFRINNLSRDDGGTYTLRFTDEMTGKTADQSLVLRVEEPVSSARLSLGCLSLGERTASCVSEGGESHHYSWTLDGRALTDAQLLSGSSSTADITLRQNVSGELLCRVWNHVSSVSTTEQMSTCGFIFVWCISNGTQISQWVPGEKEKTLCPETSVPDSHGLEISCDGRQNGAECYGPLEGAALIQLMDNASQIPRFELIKDNEIRLRWVGRLITNLTGSGYAFTSSNGTFRINNLSRDDGGTYTLRFTDQMTGETTDRSVVLHVEEPVSAGRLSLGCLSLGGRAAFCVSEGGESLHYSWTLDGQALTDAQLFSGSSSTATIILRQNVSGELLCRVWNHVSSLSTTEQMSTCGKDFRLMNTWRLSVAALVVVVVVVGLTCCVYWPVKRRRPGADVHFELKPSNRRTSDN